MLWATVESLLYPLTECHGHGNRWEIKKGRRRQTCQTAPFRFLNPRPRFRRPSRAGHLLSVALIGIASAEHTRTACPVRHRPPKKALIGKISDLSTAVDG